MHDLRRSKTKRFADLFCIVCGDCENLCGADGRVMTSLLADSANKVCNFVAATREMVFLAEPTPRICSAILLDVARLLALVAIQVLVAVLCRVTKLAARLTLCSSTGLCLVPETTASLALPALKSLVSETIAIFALDYKALLLQMSSLSAALALPALFRFMTISFAIDAKRGLAFILDVPLLSTAFARQILTVLDVMPLVLAIRARTSCRTSDSLCCSTLSSANMRAILLWVCLSLKPCVPLLTLGQLLGCRHVKMYVFDL